MTEPNLDKILQKLCDYVYNAGASAKHNGIFVGGKPKKEASQAIKAIQALNEKAMPEEYEDYYATDPVRKGKKMGYNEAIRELKSIIGGDIDYE